MKLKKLKSIILFRVKIKNYIKFDSMNKLFKHSSENIVTISELMLPSHSNFGGKIHGGYILNLMDQIAFACASKHAENYCVTAAVEKVNFLQPIEVGELVTMKAAVNYVGKTSMVVGIRVESENVIKGIVKHCNSSYFTMVAKDTEGNPAKIPGLILKTEEDIRRFMRSVKRKKNQQERKNSFKEKDFDYSQHMDLLDGANIELKLM